MRIAILSPFQFRLARGIERFTWSLAAALAKHDVEVDILTVSWPNGFDWGDMSPQVRVRKAPYWRYFVNRMAVPFYVFWMLRRRYDWVIINFADFGAPTTLNIVRRFRSQRFSIIFHFPHEQVKHRYQQFDETGLAHDAAQLFAVSDFVAGGVEQFFKDRKCAVVPNGVDPDMFQPSPEKRHTARQAANVDAEAPILVSLTALEERKGVQWVIRAIPELLKTFPGLQYWVLGDGTFRASLEAEIKQLGIEDSVILMGRQSDVLPYLAAADIGCLLSYGEAFPITLVEYMAMGLPVLTSQHPPFPELVERSFGVRVDEQDPGAVADAIRQLLLQPEERRAMGQTGREVILQKYTWDHVAAKYLDELRKAQ
ncbi:MAG: glycosyltransferase family 4 protein [Anaerolineaceae bacterium]|nr:glycosyltransferase family 4 protein [Anaerolineaceae bacterium]